MKALILSLTFFLALSFPVHAQDQFMVMSVKGKVEFSNNGKEWSPVSVGMTFGPKDFIRTSFASYVKLMVNSQRLISIDENNTKALKSLKTSKAQAGSVSGRILQHTASQMKQTKSQQSGSTTIAAHRVENDDSNAKKVLDDVAGKEIRKEIDKSTTTGQILDYASKQVLTQKSQEKRTDYGGVRAGPVFSSAFPLHSVLSTNPVFEWVDSEGTSEYELVVINNSFEPILETKVKGTSFEYLNNEGKIASGLTYHWRVTRTSDGRTSDIRSFTVMPKDSVKSISQEMKQLEKELASMEADEVTTKLINAVYLEKKSLFTDAVRKYRETIRLAPDVTEYQDMLRSLLRHLNFSNEEEYLIK